MAGSVDKKVNFVKFCLKGSNIKPIANKFYSFRLGRTSQWTEDAIFRRMYLFHNLVDSKNYPAALYKIFTQTVDSSQVFETRILRRQPKIINKVTRSWDKDTIKDVEQFMTKQAHVSFFWLFSSKTKLPRLLFSSSVICLVRSIARYWNFKKDWIILKYINSWILTIHFTIQILQL